jgi:ubiquinone/menaquinone biosynthesis C-methylase UbiE
MTDSNVAFTGSIPENYDRHLGPVIFAPYAEDLARRVASGLKAGSLLEIACGTGILTERLDQTLGSDVRITATDLNEPMIAYARKRLGDRPRIHWKQADAMALPFGSGRFEALACQFGLMFVPDKTRAIREARRVLTPGGRLALNVWCSLDDNPFGRIAHEKINSFFLFNPPTFYQIPFGFHDPETIQGLLAAEGFQDIELERVTLEARAESAHSFATGLVHGNPTATAIHDAGLEPAKIVDGVAAELAREFGEEPLRAPMNALVVTARAAD